MCTPASPSHSCLLAPLTLAPRPLPAAARRPQVATLPELAQYQLWLVDWGYNTAEERRRAAASDRIQLVGIQSFLELTGAAANV